MKYFRVSARRAQTPKRARDGANGAVEVTATLLTAVLLIIVTATFPSRMPSEFSIGQIIRQAYDDNSLGIIIVISPLFRGTVSIVSFSIDIRSIGHNILEKKYQ